MSEVGKASIKLEVDSSQLSEALAKGVEQAMKTITSSLNLDEVVGQKSKAAGDTLEKNISDGAKGADDSLKKVGEDGFDGVDQGSKSAGENIAKNISDGAKAANTALDGVGDGAFTDVAQEATTAGGAISSAMSSAAEAAQTSLSGVDGDVFHTVAQEAVDSGGAVSSAMSRAADAASESLSGVGTGAFRNVSQSAASAQGEVTGSFSRAAASANEALSTVGAGAFNAVPAAAESAASKTSGIFSSMAAKASEAGSNIKSTLGGSFEASTEKAGMVPPAVGKIGGAFLALAGPAKILKSGFDRLMSMQRAEIIFKNIGLSAKDTKAQMAKLSEQVTGTSMSLSDAAMASAAFAQSGVKIGDQMNNAMQAFVNLDTIAGDSAVNVQSVMQQISAQGKITGGDLMQLSDAGINAAVYIADAFGVTEAEARELVSSGKVSFDQFVDAVVKGTGDLSKEMGETLPSKIMIFGTALANLGATIIEPFIPGITAAFDFGIAIVKGAVAPLQDFKEWLDNGSAAATVLKAALAGIGATVAIGTIIGLVNAMKEMKIVTDIAAGAMKALNLSFLFSPIGLIITAIAAVVTGLTLFFTKTEAGRNAWHAFTEKLKEAWAFIKNAFTPAWNALKNAISNVIDYVKNNWRDLIIWVGPIGLAVRVVVDHWDQLKQAIANVFNYVKDNWRDLIMWTGPFGFALRVVLDHWQAIKNGFSELVDFISNNWQRLLVALGPLGMMASVVIQNWDRITGAIDRVMDKVTIAKEFLTQTLGQLRDAFVTGEAPPNGGYLGRIIGADRAEWVMGKISDVKGAWSDFSGILSRGEESEGALSRLLGIKKDGWIIGHLHDVHDAFTRLKDTVTNNVGKIRDAFNVLRGGEASGFIPPELVDRLNRVRDAFRDAGEKMHEAKEKIHESMERIGKAFQRVKEAFKKVGEALAPIFGGGGKAKEGTDALSNGLSNAGEGADASSGPLGTFLDVITKIAEVLTSDTVIRGIELFAGALEKVAQIIGFIADVISFVTDMWAGTAETVAGFVEFVAGIFERIALGWENLKLVWDIFSLWISERWEGFKEWAQGLWDGIRDRISSAWESIWSKITEVWNRITGWISEQWNGFTGWVSGVWGGIRDRIAGAWDSIWGTIHEKVEWIKGKFGEFSQSARDRVEDALGAFGRFKDRVGDAFRGARDWLVDAGRNIVHGLMDGIGSLAGKIGSFFLDKLPGWIKKPFMKALGIHSPSRVFAAYGENIGEGLIRGMSAMSGQVSAKSDELAVAARTNVPEIAAPGVPAPSVPAAASAVPAAVPAAAAAAPAAAPAPVQAQPISATSAPEMMGAAQDAFTGMAAAMSAAETGVLAPMWAQETANAGMFGGTVAGAATGTALPAWQMMASGMGMAAMTLMSPMFATQTAATQAFGGTVSNTALGVIAPAWAMMAGQFPAQVNGQINPALGAMGAGLWNVLNTGVNPVFGAIQGGLQTVVGAFGTGVNAITAQWDRVREATASPVRFAIQSVFNDGLVGMWNSVSDLLGTQKMGAYPVRFATGGYVRGPGGPTADKVPALLSNGEYVVKAAAVDKIGVQNLNALNSGAVGVAPGVMKDPKQRESALNDRTFKAMASRYAGGGVVQGTKAWDQLRRGMMWAKSRHGRPYVLGGDAAGSGGTDCSGFMSGIADVIQGGAGHRQWATMAFNGGGNSQYPSGPQGFAAGLRNGFAIGVTNGGAAGGHTAGTIGGVEGLPAVNVESGGSPSMVKFGVGAAGANNGYFRTHYHLPFTADGGFVSGGGGVDFGELIRSSMEPHKKRMMAAAQGFKASHPGLMGGVPLAVAEKLSKAIEAKADKLAEAMGGDPGGGGVARWAPLVRRALAHVGFPVTEANVRAMLAQIQSESGGNPNINQQIHDVNGTGASAGQGLLQIIPGTFAAHRDPSLPNDRRHPFANMVAALRYYKSRYGMDLNKMWGHGHGYDLGGVMSNPGMFGKFTSEPERVLSPQQTASFDRLVNWLDSTTAPTVRSHRPGTAPDYGDGRNVRTVAVTQHIMGGNAQDTANAVEDRLMKLMV